MNRILTWIAVFLLLGGLWLSVGWISFAEDDSCTVTELSGTVMVKRAGSVKEFKAFRNMRLNEGDAIRTGPSSRVTIRVDAEQSFKIAANSEVVVSELKNKTGQTKLTLNVRKGGVGSDVNKKLKEGSEYKIKTPTAVMGVRGTEFFVQFEQGETDVWLTKGTVALDYRRLGNTALPLTSTEGTHEQIILTAPVKAVLAITHAIPGDVVKKYSSDGLYEEFIQDLIEDIDDYDDFLEDLEELKEKYQKSIEEREKKEKEDERDDDDVIEYNDPSVSDDDDDDDDEEDDEANNDWNDDYYYGMIPPKPAGNFAYIRQVNLQGTIHTLEQWISFTDTLLPDQVIFYVLGHQVSYSKSALEAGGMIIDLLMIP